MVNVTDRAKSALKSALSESVDESGVGLRLDVSQDGALALYPDTPKAGDEVVEHEGEALLLIAEDISGPLAGATIDFTETREGAQLIVTGRDFPLDGAGPDRDF